MRGLSMLRLYACARDPAEHFSTVSSHAHDGAYGKHNKLCLRKYDTDAC
jgi:hypothetical protein